MKACVNEVWAAQIYPKLLPEIRKELVEKLATYLPVETTEECNLDPRNDVWVYPFIGTAEDFEGFDEAKFDDFMEECEKEIMKKYHLTEADMCFDG